MVVCSGGKVCCGLGLEGAEEAEAGGGGFGGFGGAEPPFVSLFVEVMADGELEPVLGPLGPAVVLLDVLLL